MSFATAYGVSDLATRAAQVRSKAHPFTFMLHNPTFEPGGGPKVTEVPTAGPGSGSSSGGPSAPPPGSLTLPALNYTSLIEADPNYVAYENASKENLDDAASTRKAAIRALVEQYGGLPAGVSDTYGDLSAADLQAAQDNPYSQLAQLNRSYAQNELNMKRQLAARGALHSGDLGYDQNQLDTQKGQALSDLGNTFSDNLRNAINGYLGAVGQDNTDRANAIAAAYKDIMSNPLYQNGGGGTASLVSDWQSKYGKPVYQDSSGNLYTTDANGNPVPYFGS